MIARWESTQGAFIWDIPDAGRMYVRRLAKGSRLWVALFNGKNVTKGKYHPSADQAKAVAEAYAKACLIPTETRP